MLLLTFVIQAFLFFTTGSALSRRTSTGLTEDVTWDPHSLSILGQRVFILSAEFHPWRIPGDPNLWRDVFEKIKANGFNTVSFYVNWATHYPTPDTNGGAGDFEEDTYRDIQKFIDEGKRAGLWLIARPGPYINGETTGGGFPGWVGNAAGSLRTNNPNYTISWTPYMKSITDIIARNQITNGGPIILVQAENEFNAGSGRSEYMQAIIDLYRDNGIVVPIFHNDKHAGRDGNFSPDRPGPGQADIFCADSYPQGQNRWAQVQSIYRSINDFVAPSSPLCLAEFGGGFLINWGVGQRGGTGFEKYANDLTNADYENIFYKENYAQTTTILNIYMLFGGTNWGQTGTPVSYTSYDYGGGINENRVATPKMNEMRLQGLFLRVSRDLLGADYIANGTNYATNNQIYATELRNPDTGAAFYVTRHDSSVSTELTATQLNVNTSRGPLVIPESGVLTYNGRDSKIIVIDFTFGISDTTILYSTAEIMTWTTIDNTDYLVLYAGAGETGETTFLFDSEPQVDASEASTVSSSFANGSLTINYDLAGSQFLSITSEYTSIVVIILDKPTANTWHAPVIPAEGNFGNFFSVGTNESALVSGPYVIRSAAITADTLALTGDLNGTTDVEFIAPAAVTKLSWNGSPVDVSPSSRGSFTGTLPSTEFSIELPTLGNWKALGSLPEIDPNFDDSDFPAAEQTTTNYTNLPPIEGTYVLYSQQYGFYGGNLIWRGHFNATGEETAVKLIVQYGYAGGYSGWLNGVFLGSGQGNASVSLSDNTWNIPEGTLRVGEDNVLVVLQDHMGIVETSTNQGKEPIGIRGYALVGGSSTSITWKVQGNQGGAAGTPDPWRGYLNEGGLYAERVGAHLPGFPDEEWVSVDSSLSISSAGVNFFRTSFDLNLPDGVDFPIRLSFNPLSPISSNYRVQIWANGWQLGKYINNIGPQAVFVLPASILNRSSSNALAISLWSLDGEGATIEGLELIADGTFDTALEFRDYTSPLADYNAQREARPVAQYYEPM